MSTVLPRHPLVPPHVDQVLDEVGRELQITPTQFARAESAYRSVGEWLRKEGSSLAPYDPEIYPQGSMAQRTTVRPLHGEEFDLDLVSELHGWTGSAIEIHKAVGDRLAEHGEYKKMLEGKKRCWRLNYSGEFHLDALPGRKAANGPGNAIEVPDRELGDWKPSNPTDYVAWFDAQARPYYDAVEARKQEPLPAPQPGDARDPLRRAVQLMKRHRDVRFDGNPENAPRSIVLTTLAAKHYDRQESVGEALLWILNGIMLEIEGANGEPIEVLNPVNPAENFADAWEDDVEAFEEFVEYIEQFAFELRELIKAPLEKEFGHRSGRLFGVEVAKKAVETYNRKHGVAVTTALEAIGRGPKETPAKPWARA